MPRFRPAALYDFALGYRALGWSSTEKNAVESPEREAQMRSTTVAFGFDRKPFECRSRSTARLGRRCGSAGYTPSATPPNTACLTTRHEPEPQPKPAPQNEPPVTASPLPQPNLGRSRSSVSRSTAARIERFAGSPRQVANIRQDRRPPNSCAPAVELASTIATACVARTDCAQSSQSTRRFGLLAQLGEDVPVAVRPGHLEPLKAASVTTR